MLKKLVKFLENNHPDSKLKQIADALNSGELQIKPASSCSADRFVFHFGGTIILVQKDTTDSSAVYQAELSWETDFLAIHSTRSKGKGFYFIAFEFDDDYQVTLKETDKLLEDQVRNEEQNQELIDKAMPVLKGFMSAISE